MINYKILNFDGQGNAQPTTEAALGSSELVNQTILSAAPDADMADASNDVETFQGTSEVQETGALETNKTSIEEPSVPNSTLMLNPKV